MPWWVAWGPGASLMIDTTGGIGLDRGWGKSGG